MNKRITTTAIRTRHASAGQYTGQPLPHGRGSEQSVGVPGRLAALVLILVVGPAISRFHTGLAATLLITATQEKAAVSTPQEDEEEEDVGRFTVIRAGRIVTVSGDDIRNGVIIIANGKIRAVGRGLEYPGNSKIIDAREMTVMPGLINAHSRHRMKAYSRRGMNAHLTVADEYFPEADDYLRLLDTGYTVLAIYPIGTGIPGQALVVRTAGPKEQRELVSPSYLWVTSDKKTFKGALERAKKEIEKVEKARKEFEEKQKKAQQAAKPAEKKPGAKKPPGGKPPVTQPTSKPTSAPATQPTTQPAFKPPQIDPKHQPLVDLIQKKEGRFALVELRRASDYVHMADLFKTYDIAHSFHLRLFMQSDMFRVAKQMGDKNARVVVAPFPMRMPFSAERYPIVQELDRAGCEVTLTPISDSRPEHLRMFQRLAWLVRDGWTREAALKSVTLNPARLLGLEKRLGSIEKGKEADLIFLDSDPLDPFTRVRKVMILGEIVHTVEKGPR